MELLVIALLEKKEPADWTKYRSTYASLMRMYPIVVIRKKVKGRVVSKIVAYLKRHEDIWEEMFSLLGWSITNKCEVPLDIVKKIYKKLLELTNEVNKLRNEMKLPEWVGKELTPLMGFGDLDHNRATRFFNEIERRFSEYRVAVEALRRKIKRETSFVRRLRTSLAVALAIRGTHEPALRRKLRERLRALLRKGIIPIDYSLNFIITVKKEMKSKGVSKLWLSHEYYDPLEVLKELEERPAVVFLYPGIFSIDYEERSVGWGLKISEKSL